MIEPMMEATATIPVFNLATKHFSPHLLLLPPSISVPFQEGSGVKALFTERSILILA